jgi:hypothetical protein
VIYIKKKMFTPEEKMCLLNRLPPLELSYEPKLHKKVYAPLYYIIPKGPKALVWYTYWKEEHICLLVKLNERGNYSDVEAFPSVFADSLALGTIIYGTYFLQAQRHYFTCEQLYYYKGLPAAKKPYQETLHLLLELFTHQVEQIAHTKSSLVIGLPVITENYEEALEQLESLPYRTYGVGTMGPRAADYKITICNKPICNKPICNKPICNKPMPMQRPVPTCNKPICNNPMQRPVPTCNKPICNNPMQRPVPICNKPIGNKPNPFLSTKAIFKVKAGLAADNYHLYTAEDTLYETAMVPTYKCSVMMNALFRTIKENANLDLLEESDDDEEFENTQMDKFVDLEKTILMECVYSKRFKKWQPVKIVPPHLTATTLKELPKI